MSYYNDAALMGGWDVHTGLQTETQYGPVQELIDYVSQKKEMPRTQVASVVNAIYRYDTLLAMGNPGVARNLKAHITTTMCDEKFWTYLRRKIHWGGAKNSRAARRARRAADMAFLADPNTHWYGSAPPGRVSNPYGRLVWGPGNAAALTRWRQQRSANAAAAASALAALQPAPVKLERPSRDVMALNLDAPRSVDRHRADREAIRDAARYLANLERRKKFD